MSFNNRKYGESGWSFDSYGERLDDCGRHNDSRDQGRDERPQNRYGNLNSMAMQLQTGGPSRSARPEEQEYGPYIVNVGTSGRDLVEDDWGPWQSNLGTYDSDSYSGHQVGSESSPRESSTHRIRWADPLTRYDPLGSWNIGRVPSDERYYGDGLTYLAHRSYGAESDGADIPYPEPRRTEQYSNNRDISRQGYPSSAGRLGYNSGSGRLNDPYGRDDHRDRSGYYSALGNAESTCESTYPPGSSFNPSLVRSSPASGLYRRNHDSKESHNRDDDNEYGIRGGRSP